MNGAFYVEGVQVQYDPNAYTIFGLLGMSAALIFSNMGAAYGTARSGVGICSIGVLKPDLVFKSLIPVVMAGILGIYGLIVAVILVGKIQSTPLPYTDSS